MYSLSQNGCDRQPQGGGCGRPRRLTYRSAAGRRRSGAWAIRLTYRSAAGRRRDSGMSVGATGITHAVHLGVTPVAARGLGPTNEVGYDPTPPPRGTHTDSPTPRTHHSYSPPINRPHHGLSLKICNGGWGCWWPARGEGTGRGSRHQTRSRTTVQGGPPIVCSTLFSPASFTLVVTLGRAIMMRRWRKLEWQKQ